jgi:hypothetical protein
MLIKAAKLLTVAGLPSWLVIPAHDYTGMTKQRCSQKKTVFAVTLATYFDSHR